MTSVVDVTTLSKKYFDADISAEKLNETA